MIFKRKTRHESTKYGKITNGSRGKSRIPTYRMQLCDNIIETPLHITTIT